MILIISSSDIRHIATYFPLKSSTDKGLSKTVFLTFIQYFFVFQLYFFIPSMPIIPAI
jgi:hypothetical protein